MRTERLAIAIAAALVGAGLAGCAGSSKQAPTGRPLALADFVDDTRADLAVVEDDDPASETPPSQDDDRPLPPPLPPEPAVIEMTETTVRDTPAPVDTLPEPLPEGEEPAMAPVMIVDSLVGQVNGRPIYASEFFENIEDRLIAMSEQYQPAAFRSRAAMIIVDELRSTVINELVLAEARSNVSVEQQQGLLNWLRQREISRSGGTRTGAANRALQQEGINLDDLVGRQLDEALIMELLRERIERNIIVTWRDIEREFRRYEAQFQQKRELVLSRIRVSRSQPERVAEVTERLVDGESFADVAESIGEADRGQWQTFALGDGGLDDIELSDAIKEKAALELEVGFTSEPFEFGSSIWWLQVTEIVEPETFDLYDPAMQRNLSMQIRGRRRAEEQDHFITELMEGGVMDEMALMADRLLAIALIRYAQ